MNLLKRLIVIFNDLKLSIFLKNHDFSLFQNDDDASKGGGKGNNPENEEDCEVGYGILNC